mgnify:CR=1 FL=1
MTQDELRKVIEGPAAKKVIYFEPADLVDDLILPDDRSGELLLHRGMDLA